MKKIISFRRRRAKRTNATRRAHLLAAFDRSGLSSATFARQHGIHYTTFCGWRHQRTRIKAAPDFVQVELREAPLPVELVIELGPQARMRISSSGQIELAACLLSNLNPAPSC